MTNWIKCLEKSPKFNEDVLIQEKDGFITIAYYQDMSAIDESNEWWGHYRQCYPIYWQPLPPPEKE